MYNVVGIDKLLNIANPCYTLDGSSMIWFWKYYILIDWYTIMEYHWSK